MSKRKKERAARAPARRGRGGTEGGVEVSNGDVITWTDEETLLPEDRKERMALFAALVKRERKAAKRVRDAARVAAGRKGGG